MSTIMKRARKTITKDEYLGLRLPREDKDKLEEIARRREVSRDPSDLAWWLIRQGLDRIEQQIEAGKFGTYQ
jgi:hypothetical protein